MKIRSLELEQFRKFEQRVRLDGFSDTLNVLCGPNEFGKSTILAAVRGLLFERYSSKAEPVRRMQPWRGSGAPRLAMTFDLGDGSWRIEKRFLLQPMARLTGPDGRIFEADAAEEELQRLLGFGAAGKKGATAGQLGVWGALWVQQRESMEQADLSSDLARATVSSCLDAEVGVLTGSEKGQAILRKARAQLAELLDGRGKPKGRYKEATEAVVEIERQLIELRARADRLAADAESFRLATQRRQKLEDPAEALRKRDALDDARRRAEAARLFAQTRAAAEAQHDLACQAAEAAGKERQARQTRRRQINEAAHVLAARALAVQSARGPVAEADASLQTLRQQEEAAQRAAKQAAGDVQQVRRLLDLARRAATLEPLRATLAQAEAAQDRIADLVARLERLPVTRDRLTELNQAAREHEAAQSALHAQATGIDFELETAARSKIALDGADLLRDRLSVSVVTPAEIAIAGIGRIVVRPAIRDLDKLQARARKAAARLEELLAQCGCRDIDEAQARFTERSEAEAALQGAKAQLERLIQAAAVPVAGGLQGAKAPTERPVPDDRGPGLPPGPDALREYLKVLERQVELARQELGVERLPDLAEAEAMLRRAEDAAQDAQDSLTQMRAGMDAALRAANAARAALMKAESDARVAQADHDRLRREDQQATARESDEDLAARLDKAEAERAACAQRLATLDRERSPDTVEAMEARIQRYEQAVKNRSENLQRVREEIASLRARITQEGGAGLDELIASAERELDAATRERDACRHEAEVLALLIDTLTEAERETKERYLAPVVRRVTPYLRSLFPSADIVCDENLRITGLSRDGTGLQEFERLSDGTQEQLAVLARLGFADLLTDQGKPAMVILDDALAYSDGERIERMFDILAQAARRTQILVLTCREDLFARLGGNQLTLSVAAQADR